MPDFQPQEPTPLRVEHMKEVLLGSDDPERTLIAFSLSGRDYNEAMFICDTLLGLWNRRRERCRVEGREMPPFIDEAHVHDPIYTKFFDQVPPCCKNYFAYRVDLMQEHGQLNDKQLLLLGSEGNEGFDPAGHAVLSAMMGEERACQVERTCRRLPSPADFARLLINLASGPNPPFDLAAARTQEVQGHFDYCLNPQAKSTPKNVRKWIDKICTQRVIDAPLTRKGLKME